ncbi:MAG TPA: type II toxin-antitoxin system RelE/ParE family toxin [Desulfobaccales bacterium]
MALYKIDFKPSAEKDLRHLPRPTIARLKEKIEKLRAEPLPIQAIKLSTAEHLYRIRVGDYRIIYEVDEKEMQVTIHYIRHRRQVYRDL